MNTQRLIAALCFALFCSGLFTWQLNRHMAHPAASAVMPVRSVVVAARDLAAGEALTTASLSIVTLPAAQPLQGLISKPQDVAGRVLLAPVSSGEAITIHDLTNVGAAAGLAATIPNGMRMISLPATEQTGSSSLLAPGNHVDIFVSYHSDAEASMVSSLILQDVAVVASSQRVSSGADSKPPVPDAINLLVTPEDAARITAANALGKLTFALRNGMDRTHDAGLTHVTLTAQRTASPSPERTSSRKAQSVAAPKSKGFVVETLSGGKSSAQTFFEGGQ